MKSLARAVAAVATLIGVLVSGLAVSAVPSTAATAGTETCEWVRSIPQSHQEFKYKQTIPAVAGVKEYLYKKEVKTYKTLHWAKYQKHVKGRIEKKRDGYWLDTGSDFDWTRWEGDFWNTTGSFKVRDWADTPSPDVIEEGGHSAVSDVYTQNGYYYRWAAERYSYRVIDRDTREVLVSSTWVSSGWTTDILGSPWIKVDERWKIEPVPAYDVFYVTGGTSTTTNTDANWTTDMPGSAWTQFDQRIVQDQPINQGPVRSAEAPPLNYDGVNSDVPWTKVDGSCISTVAVPTVPVLDECGPGNAVFGTVPPGPWSVVNNTDGSITINANAGINFLGGVTSVTQPAPVDSNEACPVPPVVPPVPPTPPTYDCPQGTKWVDSNNDGVVQPSECKKPGKAKGALTTSCKGQAAARIKNGTFNRVTYVLKVRSNGSVKKERFVLKAGTSRYIVRDADNGSTAVLKFKGHKPIKKVVPKRCGTTNTGLRASNNVRSASLRTTDKVVRRDF